MQRIGFITTRHKPRVGSSTVCENERQFTIIRTEDTLIITERKHRDYKNKSSQFINQSSPPTISQGQNIITALLHFQFFFSFFQSTRIDLICLRYSYQILFTWLILFLFYVYIYMFVRVYIFMFLFFWYLYVCLLFLVIIS